MKINGTEKVDGCFYCDYLKLDIIPKCLKFNLKADNNIQLFEKCRLPELKEIKVWFELRPENADKMDVCVYCNEFGTWEIDIKIFSQAGEWVQLTAFIRKIDAESFLGCKIPEEVKP